MLDISVALGDSLMMSSGRLARRLGALTVKVLSLACIILYFNNEGGVMRF